MAYSATAATSAAATLFSFCMGQRMTKFLPALSSLSLVPSSCVTAGGVSVLLDVGQAARSVEAPQTSTEQR